MCVCARARVRVINNVNYTDQDGNTETSITFLILIQMGHADVNSSKTFECRLYCNY